MGGINAHCLILQQPEEGFGHSGDLAVGEHWEGLVGVGWKLFFGLGEYYGGGSVEGNTIATNTMKPSFRSLAVIGVLTPLLTLSSCVVPYDGGYAYGPNYGPGPAPGYGYQSTRHATNGTVGGALLGAAAGGIIGNQSGRGLEGAAIGGLLGAFAGGALGQSRDRRNAYRQASYEPNYGGYEQNYGGGYDNGYDNGGYVEPDPYAFSPGY